MSKLISCWINEVFTRTWKNGEFSDYQLQPELIEDQDKVNNTYLCICGPTQDDWLEKIPEMLEPHNGKIIYQSPKALNFEHDTDTPRNTLVLFEFD
jgi:hypothetical protein